MVKRKTAQELMAERNPLGRTPVAPVDIYSQPFNSVDESKEKQEPTGATSETQPSQVQPLEAPRQKDAEDRERPYSTYLLQSQVKGIKLRAIDRDLDDKDIMQEAVQEYLQNHPLP
jgi:hypothetical protein